MKTSSRSETPPFRAMDVLAEALRLEAEGHDIVHMEIGEPAFGAPHAAIEAVSHNLAAGASMGYTDGLGLPELRRGIAAMYARRHGIGLDPERVVVTASSSSAFTLSFLALFDAGARLGIGEPGYPAYRNIASVLGLEAVGLETALASRFQPTPEDLDRAAPLDGLLVASPSNPTGTMLDRAAMERLAEACAERGIALISDEIYHGITYGAPAVSALEVTDEVVVINSFSKYHAMTGWRVGWMVVPESMVRRMQTLAQNLFICPSHPGQIAALGALTQEGETEVAGLTARYADNRRIVMEGLARLGFAELAPCDGAFYAYANVGGLAPDSPTFCSGLLRHAGVATTPGLDFDPRRGDRTVRFSFAHHPERIAEGMRRIEAYVRDGCPA